MNDVDWLVDYLSQVFKGPTWQTPILDFIDDNCYMFDNTEENRLEYTPVYNQFCALLERLLEEHLRKIGISNEDFMLVMESLSDDSDLHKLVTQYVLAIDDMTVFKKMMARRNAGKNVLGTILQFVILIPLFEFLWLTLRGSACAISRSISLTL